MGIIGWLKIIYTVISAIITVFGWLDKNDPTYTAFEKEEDAKELGLSLLDIKKGNDVSRFNRLHERLRARKSRRLLALRSGGAETLA
jgi:hypothetical protein